MVGELTRFYNCRILRNHMLYEDDLWVSDGEIVDPEIVFFELKRKADEEIDLDGAIVAPGFIDIQINGGYGVDFTHDLITNPDGLDRVAKNLLAHGVTAFCPTLVSTKREVYHKVLKYLAPKQGGIHGAEVLGAHLEGPFINKSKKGAHEEDSITNLKDGISTLQDMYGSDIFNAKIVTLAPEMEKSQEAIEWLTYNNIVVSLGHSTIDTDPAKCAINSGARIITHLFNAMLPFHHRNPGLVGLLASDLQHPIFYGIIADGIHTHPSSLRIAYRTCPEGVILVTDAISAMGLENGVHYIGEKKIRVSDYHAYLDDDSNTLCGSIAPMDKCLANFMASTGCSIVQALEAASLHPAKALRLEKTKGTLNVGSEADFVVLNNDLNVISTYIAGKCVYTNPNYLYKSQMG